MPPRFPRLDERVRIDLDGTPVEIASEYQISQRFFTQPSAFSIRVGSNTTTAALMEEFRPGRRFNLYIGDVLQMSGRIDGWERSGDGTQLEVRGRDSLAQMHDAYVLQERSFGSITYREFVEQCIKASGIDPFTLEFSNETNRRRISAVTRNPQVKPARSIEGAKIEDGAAAAAKSLAGLVATAAGGGVGANAAAALGAAAAAAGDPTAYADAQAKKAAEAAAKIAKQQAATKKSTAKAVKASVGETWFQAAKRKLDTAGMFLFATVDDSRFIVTEPNANQHPIYRIVRRKNGESNVLGQPSFRFDTQGRHSEYRIYGRTGKGKKGTTQIVGVYVDDEMQRLGFNKPYTEENKEAKSTAHANFLARRVAAKERRDGFTLAYSVSGHRTELVYPNGQVVTDPSLPWVIWTIDTIVFVDDEYLGIKSLYWIEGVTFHGSADGQTRTELNLVRPRDLVFGDGLPDS
ncbi:MAG: hypothetical protein ACTHU0_01320 [Kofleriaceae bacterium]